MIKRIAAEQRGIKSCVQKVFYRAVALPIVKYGAVLWHDVVYSAMAKRNILALQRALLLLLRPHEVGVSTEDAPSKINILIGRSFRWRPGIFKK